MTNSTPTYTPTVGDICYMVKGDSDNRTFGAMVRVTKTRSWKYVTKVWIENVEGLGYNEDCLEFTHYGALSARDAGIARDVARVLLNAADATIEDKENLAAARINRAKREAEAAQKRRDAEAHEREFIKHNRHIVDAPLDFTEPSVVVSKDCNRVVVSSVAAFTKFMGHGFDIGLKNDSVRVSAWFQREEIWNSETCSYQNTGKFVLHFNGANEMDLNTAFAFSKVLNIAVRGMESLNVMIDEGIELHQEMVSSLFAHAMA